MNRLVPLFVCLFFGPLAQAQTVFMSPEEALKIEFKTSQAVGYEKKMLTAQLKTIAEKSLRAKISREEWTIYVAKTGENVDGYAIIDQEVGRMEPITFMTSLSPQGEIRSVEILVYRESQGSEVKDSRFLGKFSGKTLQQPIRPNVDIPNISGATLSVRAVSLGARRALAIWDAFYGAHK